MATTIDSQTLEAMRLSNFLSLQNNISITLAEYFASRGVLSISEFESNATIDLTNVRVLSQADIKGIQLFAPYCENLILPALAKGILTNGSINISEFKKLKKVIQQSRNGGGSYSAFYGDMSSLNSLVELDITFSNEAVLQKWVLPTLSSNSNLEKVTLLGNVLPSLITLQNIGNLQSNLKLKEYSLTYLNINNPTVVAIINNILSTLKAQKIAGGAISKIELTNCPAPTNGTNNADYLWLIQNGVNVTLGSFV